MEAFQIIADVGFPIASALAGGFFVFLTLRFILDGVLGDIITQRGFVKGLENRIKTMNNDMIKIDLLISSALELKPDIDRIARAENFLEDEKIDSRRD